MSEDPWAGIAPAAERLVGVRITPSHPLDVYWVRASDGSPGLLLRGIDPARIPYQLPKPRGLALEVGREPDWPEVRMFLREQGDLDVFRTLCHDVIAYSESEASGSAATARVFRRLSHWHSLMSRARSTALAPNEIRGLIGELTILERLITLRGVLSAIRAWVAPDDHPQDFALDRRLVEVKARAAGSRQHVQISSLEQLESSQMPVSLAVVELVCSDAADAATLNQLCDRIGVIAQAAGVEQEDAFQASLLKRGYIRQEAYDAEAYRVAGVRCFDVREDFPRLTRRAVDVRVVRARYVLDLAYLEPFEMPLEAALG